MTRNPAYDLNPAPLDFSGFRVPDISDLALYRPPDPLLTPETVRTLVAGMQNAVRRAGEAVAGFTTRMRAFMARVQETYNTPPALAGVEATYRVRAALDPAYDTEEALSGLVCDILRGKTGDHAATMLYAAHRREVAVAAMCGWLTTHPEDTDLSWDLHLGTARVEFRPIHVFAR